MSRPLKALLRAVAVIFLWGGPIVGAVGLIGSIVEGVDPTRLMIGLVLLLYFAIGGVFIGAILQLLLSIDDRLERIEGKS